VGDSDLEQRIIGALDKHRFAAFATVENNKPKARYMALFHENLTIHLATNRKTHKVEELQANPHVYLLLGYDGKSPSEVVEIEGTAKITSDDSLREKYWGDEFKQWFDGPQDPDYVILEITPSRIEYSGEDRQLRIWERE
jgi:general stress protein 26